MNRRPVLIAAAVWLLTLAVAFSLGRRAAPTAAPGVAAVANATPGGSSANGKAPEHATESELAKWFGLHAGTLTEVTNGRPLGEHVKRLLAIDDEATRMLGFLRLVEALEDPEQIKEALAVLARESNGRFRFTEQAMLAQKWAKSDPKAAAQYANELRDFSRMNLMSAVLRTWLAASPDEAIAWAVENGANNPGGPGRGPDGADDNWAVATLVGSLAKSDLQKAMQVAAEQPYGRARGRMVDSLVTELVSQRGDAAARNAVLDLSDDKFRAGFAARLAERFAGTDPNGTVQWAAGLPAGETREKALASAVSSWAAKDPVAAGNYLRQSGTSPEYDQARKDYAEQVLRTDPEGAMAWAQAITDANGRTAAVQELLGSWTRRDATAAAAWAQANGVAVQAPQRGGRGPGGGGGFRAGGR